MDEDEPALEAAIDVDADEGVSELKEGADAAALLGVVLAVARLMSRCASGQTNSLAPC